MRHPKDFYVSTSVSTFSESHHLTAPYKIYRSGSVGGLVVEGNLWWICQTHLSDGSAVHNAIMKYTISRFSSEPMAVSETV